MQYDGSELKKIRVEETEYIYDLQVVLEELIDLISFTGVDFSTVAASRILLADNEQNKADECIRLTDTYGNELMYDFVRSMLRNHTDIILVESGDSPTIN